MHMGDSSLLHFNEDTSMYAILTKLFLLTNVRQKRKKKDGIMHKPEKTNRSPPAAKSSILT